MANDPLHEIKRVRSDYAATFKSPRAKRVLRDLMRRFNISRPHLTNDANELFFAEGQRSVILHIFTMLRLSDAEVERLMMQQPTMYENEEL